MQLPVALAVPIGSFFQGNRHLLRTFFDRVAELIGPGDGPVIDLHAGVGFLAAAAISVGRSRLTAVEPHPGAAEAAGRNLPTAEVFTGTAEAYLERQRPPAQDATVIIDPPRTGLSKPLRRRLAEWQPARILSIGCDPATWSRDVTELLGVGYELSRLELLDLFPSTHHVEILALLERG
jgi:tRNA (uracil-5-)-methyltransferase